MTSAIKLTILEFLYTYYIEHQGEQFGGDIEQLQECFPNIPPQMLSDAAFALLSEQYIDGFCADDTLSYITIRNAGVTRAEKLVAAKNNINVIEGLNNEYKVELSEALPDLIEGTPKGIENIPKIRTILSKLTLGVRDIVVNIISNVASDVIVKTINMH